MAEQVICNIERPEVGVSYVPASKEAVLADRLAAEELSLVTLAKHIRDIRSELGIPCPQIIADLANSDLWLTGM